MFNEDYRPREFSEIHGQKKPLKDIIAWLNTWPSSKKALLIHGPHGIGKTVSVYVLKEQMNLDLIELNTSDVRDAETIEKVVGNAARSRALFHSRKLILIDEVDNIKGRSDQGGMKALAKIIDETENPIMLIANDPYKLPSSIRNKVDSVKFNTLRAASIKNRLKEISEREGIAIADEQLGEISERSGGDMRAAINDIESLGSAVSREDVGMLSPRDSESSIFEGLTSIFKLRSTKCREIFFDVDKPPDEIIFWIDENMPRTYHPDDIACAYNYLSRADVFLGRVGRRQYYRFWAYAMDLMTGGVSVCHKKELTFSRYEPPSYFRYMGRTKALREVTNSLLAKIGGRTHSSRYDARAYLPLLELACKDVQGGIAVLKYFDLEYEEMELICPGHVKDIFKAVEEMEKKADRKAAEEGEGETRQKRRPNHKPAHGEQTSLFQF